MVYPSALLVPGQGLYGCQRGAPPKAGAIPVFPLIDGRQSAVMLFLRWSPRAGRTAPARTARTYSAISPETGPTEGGPSLDPSPACGPCWGGEGEEGYAPGARSRGKQ
jgi:hypothetical protein